jgi:hypothetical protein
MLTVRESFKIPNVINLKEPTLQKHQILATQHSLSDTKECFKNAEGPRR